MADKVIKEKTKKDSKKVTAIKELKFLIKKTREDAVLPVYKTKGAACLDCYAAEDKWIWLKPKLVPLGFALGLPEGYEAQMRGRSGLSLKGHYTELGTVDCDYRGEVSAITWSLFPYKVKKGDRVCQMKISKANQFKFEEVKTLDSTERGSGGFGSTGK